MVSPSPQRFELKSAPLNEGTVLLEASAGTGKTYTLTGILVRMLLEEVIEDVEQALVVTFTVAAADELKNRLRAAIHRAHKVCLGHQDEDSFFQGLASAGDKGAKILRQALDDFDRASVMTIHGFCKRLLDESAFQSDEPFDLDFATDEAPLWRAAAADAFRVVRQHDSLILGAVLEATKLTPDILVSLYRNWQRYPNVRLDPAEPQLSIHLETLSATVHAAAGHWDDELVEHLANLKWLKDDRPAKGDLEQHFKQCSAPLSEDKPRPDLCLSTFSLLSKSKLPSKLHKRPAPTIDHPFFAICDEVDAQREAATAHLYSELLLQMHNRLERLKRDRAVLTFDDLLARTDAAVTHPQRKAGLLAAIQGRYSVALIDEFQDTDERQYSILSNCFRNRPLFLVGDPKQSIYSFRGADLDTYLGASRDAVERHTLSVNFRSAHLLVNAVNHLFSRNGSFIEPDIRMPKVRANANPDELLITDDQGDDSPMQFRMLAYATNPKGDPKMVAPEISRVSIARDVTAEIQRLLDGPSRIDGRKILPRDIAVLTRRNVEAVLIQEHLRDRGLVSVIGKAGDVFATDELQELERLLLAIHRPNDAMLGRAAFTTRLWGYTAEQLAALEADEGKLETELNRLESWRHDWAHRGFVVMKERMLQDLNVNARMLAYNDGERRLTNLQQLCEMLHQAEHEHRLSPEGLLHWLQHERSHKDEVDYQRRELRLESDEDAVQILTMHGSKGLQYEIVFCPFLWDGRAANSKNTAVEDFSDGARPGGRRFAFRVDMTDPSWLAAEADRLAEDARLAYVAMTRAKRRCYVHWGPIGSHVGGYWRSALGWLLQRDQVDQSKAAWQVNWAKDYKTRVGSMADDIHEIAQQSDGAISVDEVPDLAPLEATTQQAAVPEQHDAQSKRGDRRRWPSRDPWQVHSFSSLVANSEPGNHAREVRDPAADDRQAGEGIFGFARGAAPGLCLHTILEHLDLNHIDDDDAHSLVTKTLAHHGMLDQSAHPGVLDPTEAVLQNMRDLAAARVHEDGPTLLDIWGDHRIAEWKFTIRTKRPNFDALAAAFAESGCQVASGYADRLRHLKWQQYEGYLTGFVDLITEANGRYWVIDWKSNHLGNTPSSYGPESLLAAMHSHDYVLQYHLYVLAWHRHLRARLPAYDYDTHFGGVSYAFLRGAQPNETTGMFYGRPPRQLVDAMDAWAEPAAAAHGGEV